MGPAMVANVVISNVLGMTGNGRGNEERKKRINTLEICPKTGVRRTFAQTSTSKYGETVGIQIGSQHIWCQKKSRQLGAQSGASVYSQSGVHIYHFHVPKQQLLWSGGGNGTS